MNLSEIISDCLTSINKCQNKEDVYRIKSLYIGKQSKIAEFTKNIKHLSQEEKINIGHYVNNAIEQIEKMVSNRINILHNQKIDNEMLNNKIDVTIDVQKHKIGKMHPLTYTFFEMVNIMEQFGFEFIEGPEIENDWYNFSALNIPENHPARCMHDTFYLNNGQYLLRTHTSNVQIRALENKPLPLKSFTIGKTYRYDSDATHLPMFHQIEGICIDKDVTVANLKWMMCEIMYRLFGKDIEVRFRPSYFPFTEPSLEIDVMHPDRGLIEVAGCGMVHKNVLKNCNISNEYNGFAFGIGLERISSIKQKVTDIRNYIA